MLDCLKHDQIVTKWIKLGLEGMPICYHHVSVIIIVYVINKVIVQILTWAERGEAFQCCMPQENLDINPDYSLKGVINLQPSDESLYFRFSFTEL